MSTPHKDRLKFKRIKHLDETMYQAQANGTALRIYRRDGKQWGLAYRHEGMDTWRLLATRGTKRACEEQANRWLT